MIYGLLGSTGQTRWPPSQAIRRRGQRTAWLHLHCGDTDSESSPCLRKLRSRQGLCFCFNTVVQWLLNVLPHRLTGASLVLQLSPPFAFPAGSYNSKTYPRPLCSSFVSHRGFCASHVSAGTSSGATTNLPKHRIALCKLSMR